MALKPPSTLQIQQSLLLVVDTTALTIDVVTFYPPSPRTNTDKSNPPRSIPLPPFLTSNASPGTTLQYPIHLTSIDTSFGIYAASGTNLTWIPITTPYSPAPASTTDAVLIRSFTGVITALHLYLSGVPSTLYVVEHIAGSGTTVWKLKVSGGTILDFVDNGRDAGGSLVLNGAGLGGVRMITFNSTRFPYSASESAANGTLTALISVTPSRTLYPANVTDVILVSFSTNTSVYLFAFADGMGGSVNTSGSAWPVGIVNASVKSVTALEVDRKGTGRVFVGGDDGKGVGVVGLWDLATLGDQAKSGGSMEMGRAMEWMVAVVVVGMWIAW
ncbi:hypothetical protein HK101_011280 [Irineochytrium annulatum]|nr:hypothetical protein HK101_011280 [Irineochytrium annulatum]